MEQKGFLVHLRHLSQLMRGHGREFLIGALVIVAIDALDLTPALAQRSFINGLTEGHLGWDLVLGVVGVIVGATLVMAVLRYTMRRVFSEMALRVSIDLRQDLYLHLQTLEPKFYSEMRVGDLMQRMTNDLQAVRMALARGAMLLVDLVANMVLVTPLMLWLNWKLALCSLVTMVWLPLFVKKVGDRVHNTYERVQEQMGNVGAQAQENITGIRVVKAYAQEQQAIAAFKASAEEYLKRNLWHAKWMALFEPTIGFALGVNLVVVVGVSGWQILVGGMTLGDFVAYQQIMMRLMFPMIGFGWVVSLVQRGSASLKRITELLETVPEVRDGPETVTDMTAIRGDIEFRRLTFSYDGRPVLKDVSLRVPCGTTLAVVGEVGSGKSTLANMLGRFVEPPDGTVFVDGVDVKRIPLATLRAQVGYVPQETFLFSTSIRNNIAFGQTEVADERVEWAADVSQLNRDVEVFPERYESLLGERGINLSGGQKQRVAIARAVLVDPRILVLDDALSSVDTHTEEEILKRLRAVMRQRTSIIVAHRLSTLREADQIIVLDQGQIVERGTHEELVAKNGLYAGIYRKQLLEEELEEA
ncbi:MAG: ABC transporter ATP-binding protein [Verrucomicrobia bacterium]|nr:ABC transporter ATP-binding protein [Verrucomicrobiota bacterium]